MFQTPLLDLPPPAAFPKAFPKAFPRRNRTGCARCRLLFSALGAPALSKGLPWAAFLFLLLLLLSSSSSSRPCSAAGGGASASSSSSSSSPAMGLRAAGLLGCCCCCCLLPLVLPAAPGTGRGAAGSGVGNLAEFAGAGLRAAGGAHPRHPEALGASPEVCSG